MAKSDAKKSTKKTKAKKGAKSLFKSLKGKLKTSRKELISQVDHLTNEISEFKNNNSSKKVIKKLEKKYKKQISNLQQDFNEQLDKLHDVQSKVIESLPQDIRQKLHIQSKKQEPAKNVEQLKSKKSIKPKSELAAINGIGPVTLKKLQEAGISSLEDLANPPANKVDALKAFEKTKGFETWVEQANKLLSK